MSPQALYAVAIQLMAAWFVSTGICYLLMMFTGPLAYLIVGVVLLFYARSKAVAWTAAEGDLRSNFQ